MINLVVGRREDMTITAIID